MVSIIIDQYIKIITHIANDRFEKLRLNFKDALNTMKRIGLRMFFLFTKSTLPDKFSPPCPVKNSAAIPYLILFAK